MKTAQGKQILLRLISLVSVPFCITFFGSCNQKISQSQSPTAPSVTQKTDYTSAISASKAVKPKGSDTPSTVQPLLRTYTEGSVYNTTTTEWMLVHFVPAVSHNGTYTMFTADNCTIAQCATMLQYYGFSRAVCSDGSVPNLLSANFSLNQILVQIGNGGGCGFPYPSPGPGLFSNWQALVDKYKNTVLGYYYDEPSGWTTGAAMQSVAGYIHTTYPGAKLWLDDYDTGVISSILYFTFHNCHLADDVMLHYGDYIMSDADNASATNGWDGIGCYIGQDYNEFQSWFPFQPTFNTIYTMSSYPNEGSLMNWMDAHLNSTISNFAL